MAAYPTEGSMGELIRALKSKALQTAGALEGIDHFASGLDGWYVAPFQKTTLYFAAHGSPREELSEHSNVVVERYNHQVFLDIYKHQWSLDEDELDPFLFGTESEIGLYELSEQVIDFYKHNWLDLDGLEPGEAPVLEILSGGYEHALTDSEGNLSYLMRVRIFYSVWTKPI